MVQFSRAALLTFVCALAFASDAHAAIWSQVSTGLGSGDNIRAIDYQSSSRFWVVTSNGKIATRQSDGSFAVKANIGGTNGFNDIAFKPGSNTGIAVGNNGNIWRSTDAGQTWNRVNFTEYTANDESDKYACGGYNNDSGSPSHHNPLNQTVNPSVPLYSVHWGPGNNVLITGGESTALRVDGTAGSFGIGSDIARTSGNYSSTDTTPTIKCAFGYGDDIHDGQFASSTDANQIYFLSDYGPVFFTDSGLASGTTPVTTSDIGCGGVFGRLVLDPANPINQWSVTDRGGDSGRCLYYTTTTSASDYQFPSFPNETGQTDHNSEDIAAAGSSPPTLVEVEKGGNILNSVDGVHFYYNRFSNTDTTDYYAASGYDNSNFAVGGANGRLLVTTAANSIPDTTAPTGTISGATTVNPGVPTAYQANLADEAGGSGIDPASVAWSSAGLPGQTGTTATFTFPAGGYYTLRVDFKDKAGNAGNATLGVYVNSTGTNPIVRPITTTPSVIPVGTKNPTASKTSSVAGGSVKLSGPKTCVRVGKTFTATLSFKKAKKSKKGSLVKVKSVAFSIDGKTVKNDKKAPFKQTLSVKSYTPNSKHTLKARATIKVRSSSKAPKKSIATSFQVCAS